MRDAANAPETPTIAAEGTATARGWMQEQLAGAGLDEAVAREVHQQQVLGLARGAQHALADRPVVRLVQQGVADGQPGAGGEEMAEPLDAVADGGQLVQAGGLGVGRGADQYRSRPRRVR
jgi:hypothetical protein